MTPPRTAAPHVQAALSRTAQARLPLPAGAAAPGRPPAPHVQASVASAQARLAPPPPGPRPLAAHVQAKLQAPPARPSAPHLPPPLRLPAPPARPAAAQAKAIAPSPVSRPPALPRPAFLAPSPARPPVTAALQLRAVIQPATQVSYFESGVARRARHYRRDNNVGGANLATACYKVKKDGKWGGRKYKTMPSAGEHSEKRLHDYLEDLGVTYKVLWVYTELAPCGSDFHNCAQRLENWWPDAEVYYSVDYPSLEDVSSESSDDDKKTKKRKKAKRRRRRGPATLKRFRTFSKKWDSDEEDGPDSSNFNPKLQRIHSPSHYPEGWDL